MASAPLHATYGPLVNRIVVLRGGALGDVLLGFPALRALRAAYLGAELHLVAPLPQAGLALDMGLAEAVTGLDDPALVPLFLDHPSPDRLPPFLRRADLIVVWLQGAEVIAGTLARLTGGRVVAAKALPEPGSGIHAADWLLGTLVELGISTDASWDGRAWLTVPAAGQEWAATWVDSHLGALPFVALHPGSGSGRKNWPAAAWVGVVTSLEQRYGVRLVVTAGPADVEPLKAWRAVRAGSGPPGRDDLPLVEPGLTQLAGILDRASLFLGNDSGVTHLAAGLGVPTVAVFGATDPTLWRPRGPRVDILGDLMGGWPAPEEVSRRAAGLLSATLGWGAQGGV